MISQQKTDLINKYNLVNKVELDNKLSQKYNARFDLKKIWLDPTDNLKGELIILISNINKSGNRI